MSMRERDVSTHHIVAAGTQVLTAAFIGEAGSHACVSKASG